MKKSVAKWDKLLRAKLRRGKKQELYSWVWDCPSCPAFNCGVRLYSPSKCESCGEAVIVE